MLQRLGVTADVIYVDAAHEEEELALDLELFWPVLGPGGVMFGDDYVQHWSGVVSAVDRFARDRMLRLELDGPKWLLRKPPGASAHHRGS